MLLSYFEAVFEIMELNTTEVELSGVKKLSVQLIFIRKS